MVRGAIILIEGCDRSGKTTQINMLMKKLEVVGCDFEMIKFPIRSTPTGKIIDKYLKKEIYISDEAIHLLFSANRWESVSYITEKIKSGVNVLIDRYSYSGIVYSCAKGFDYEWCKNCEIGLPKPDITILLDAPIEILSKRKNFGDEKYEISSFMETVRKTYLSLSSEYASHIIDASKPVFEINNAIYELIISTIEECKYKEYQILSR